MRIDEARSVANPGAGHLAVIGSASGGGTVSIEGNVQLGLVSKGVDYNRVDYVKGDRVMTLDEMKNSIRGDSTMSLKNEQTKKLEYIVHGENVCAHVDGEVVEKVDATCTAEGHITYRCNYEKENGATGNSCNRTWTVTIPKKDHTWGEWTTVTEATCTTDGLKEHECSECHKKEQETIPALKHDYRTEWTEDVAPTCTTEGKKSHHCTRCDAVTDVTTVPVLGHQWREDHRTGNCGVAGEIHYVCERDPSHTKTEHVEATGNHTWGEWTIVTEATCTSNGSKERECSVCHKKETETIPATGHHWVDKGDGTHTCPDCGATKGQPVNTNSALELRVVDAEGMDQPFTVSQNGTLRTYTGAYDIATLTGDLDTLRYLQDHGAQTIQFVTNGQTSSFDINDLLAQGSGSEVFYLTHRGAEEPTLLLVEVDHSDLVKD